jgi:hypothetical protein
VFRAHWREHAWDNVSDVSQAEGVRVCQPPKVVSAPVIVFKDDDETGRKKKIPSMNGIFSFALILSMTAPVPPAHLSVAELAVQGYRGIKLHKVAGKCGVFAETDINSLQKVGTPPDELMASLFEAIVLQNLSVLTRGHTLRPHVLCWAGRTASSKACARRGRRTFPACGRNARLRSPTAPSRKI